MFIDENEEKKGLTAKNLQNKLTISTHSRVDENDSIKYGRLMVAEDLLIKTAGESMDLLWVIQSIISAMVISTFFDSLS